MGTIPLRCSGFQFSGSIPVAANLLRAAIDCTAKPGKKRLIIVIPLELESMLRKAGCKTRRAGPPMPVDGRLVLASRIQVDGQ